MHFHIFYMLWGKATKNESAWGLRRSRKGPAPEWKRIEGPGVRNKRASVRIAIWGKESMGHGGRPLLWLFPSSQTKQNKTKTRPGHMHVGAGRMALMEQHFHVLPSALIKGPFKKQACLCAFHNQEEK